MSLSDRHSKKILPILALWAAMTPPAHAVAYWGTYSSTLWNTPAQHFTDKDWQLFEDTLKQTLDSAPDRETRAWSNPSSRASGEFTVLKSLRRSDRDCREVKMVSSAGGLRRVTGIAFCREEDGSWNAIPGKNNRAKR